MIINKNKNNGYIANRIKELYDLKFKMRIVIEKSIIILCIL